jgi:hypothetical protein
MNREHPARRLSDEDLERDLKGALVMDDPGQVPDELRTAVAAVPDEQSPGRARGRLRFATFRGAVAAAAALAVVAATLGIGWTLRGGNAGPAASPTPTGQTNPSTSPTQTPVSPLPATSPSPTANVRAWTSLDWSASAALPAGWIGAPGVVAWRGSLVAAGVRGDFWSSADGLSWKAHPIDDPTVFDSARVDGLVATPSGLVAYGEDNCDVRGICMFAGTAAIWLSHDGLAWEKVASTGFEPKRIADGPNGLVAVTGHAVGSDTVGSSEIWTSETGATWQRLSLDPAQFPVGSIIGDIRATPSGYLMSGAIYGRSTALAWWSKDGRSWQRADVVEPDRAVMTAIYAGSDGFLATGETSSGWTAWWSSDGHAWQPVSMPGPSSYGSLGCGVFDDGSRIIAIGGANRSYRFWTSTDGKSWRELKVSRTIPDTALPDWTVYPGVLAVVLPDGLVLFGAAEAWLLTAH